MKAKLSKKYYWVCRGFKECNNAFSEKMKFYTNPRGQCPCLIPRFRHNSRCKQCQSIRCTKEMELLIDIKFGL